jgi:plastocyanin
MDRKLFAAAAVLAALLAGAAACTSGGGQEPTPVQTWKITPASGTRPPATPATTPAVPTQAARTPAAGTPSAAATPTAATAAAGTPSAGTKITVTASNILFDKTALTAPAGQVTIELVNNDAGVPHNIHFFKGNDATGESVGMTPITTGPTTDTIALTFEKGTYFYQCDVHPTTMTGKLTVS